MIVSRGNSWVLLPTGCHLGNPVPAWDTPKRLQSDGGCGGLRGMPCRDKLLCRSAGAQHLCPRLVRRAPKAGGVHQLRARRVPECTRCHFLSGVSTWLLLPAGLFATPSLPGRGMLMRARTRVSTRSMRTRSTRTRSTRSTRTPRSTRTRSMRTRTLNDRHVRPTRRRPTPVTSPI